MTEKLQNQLAEIQSQMHSLRVMENEDFADFWLAMNREIEFLENAVMNAANKDNALETIGELRAYRRIRELPFRVYERLSNQAHDLDLQISQTQEENKLHQEP